MLPVRLHKSEVQILAARSDSCLHPYIPLDISIYGDPIIAKPFFNDIYGSYKESSSIRKEAVAPCSMYLTKYVMGIKDFACKFTLGFHLRDCIL